MLALRKGARWSDGHPLTADDIMYWWNHEFNDEAVYGAMPDWCKAGYMTTAGKRGTVEKIDDFHVKFSFSAPYPLFPGSITRNTLPILAFPAHYLKQYHPTIGDQEVCEKAMKAYKLPSRIALYTFMKHYQNPEHPRLWPWIYRTYKPTPPQVFVRNPYYFVVDTEGNQLPYIDQVQFDVIPDGQMLALSATEGRITMQTRHIVYDNYTELMSRRKTGGYRVLHWYTADRGGYVINPNLNRLDDPERPDTKKKAKLLSDKRFRQALSLAIDRKRIIKADYNNQVEPSQVGPGPGIDILP
ncbi:MAG: ABC transporter substrate-binding protein [Planctomycetota bacterium]|nr:ABC transporter substrate-binding protein [Planctomycetota bacterium]